MHYRSFTYKSFIEALHPPYCQTDVMRSPFFLGRCLTLHCRVGVRWLGSSFAKLGFSVCLCGFANVPPNALLLKN